MRIFQGIKRVVKPLVDFPTWMGYQGLVENGKAIIRGTKDLFTPPQTGRPESFTEATERLALDDAAIKRRETVFLVFAIFWALVTLSALVYTLWLMINDGLVGSLLSAALTFLAGIFTFRYHFWYLQVKNRSLGMTFNQWLNSWFKENSKK